PPLWAGMCCLKTVRSSRPFPYTEPVSAARDPADAAPQDLPAVRRGLCARPADWYWSGAGDYSGERTGPLRVDRESLPPVVVADLGRRLPQLRTAHAVPVWPRTTPVDEIRKL